MTSPPQLVTVICPECSTSYEATYRASINLDLERWTERQLRNATTAKCPSCGHRVNFDTLVVENGTWTWPTSDEEGR
mgnify:CR=1 FL=1